MDHRPVRQRQGRRHPGQHQPRLPAQRAGVRAQTVRLPLADLRRHLQDLRLPLHARRAAARAGHQRHRRAAQPHAAGAARGDQPRRAAGRRHARLAAAAGAGRAGRPRAVAPVRRAAAVRRADQHPVHLRHHRLPQGRHPQPLQHPQQRLHGRREPRPHRAGPPGHPGAAVPLLRHGDGQHRLPDPRQHHDLPERRLRAAGRPAGGGRGTRHRAVRRADHVHRHARPPRARRHGPVQPAHRHHGRRHLPDRGDEAGDRRDAHERGADRLRHDRDQPGIDPDRPGRRSGAPRDQRRPHPAAPGEQDRRRARPRGAARADRRAVHSRLQRDARLLEQPRGHPRGHRRRALDAHRRPGGDGRRGLHPHRRPQQGHDHPRRRERVPARDRGVPVHPRGGGRRAGDRRAGQQVRRGDRRLGQAASGARGRGRGAARLLQGAHRPLQDPAAHQVRQRLPDDHQRQGAEVPHARDQRGGAGHQPPLNAGSFGDRSRALLIVPTLRVGTPPPGRSASLQREHGRSAPGAWAPSIG
ncbi:conserved hypothetical protein [Pseudomonas sp. OF001]|nr:conserved hypothetical protein [Pseudomonas sp. OF001]